MFYSIDELNHGQNVISSNSKLLFECKQMQAVVALLLLLE